MLIYAEAQNEAVVRCQCFNAALKGLRSRPSVIDADIPADFQQAQ